MALTDNQKQLIQFVQMSDLPQAKKAALACIKEDTTQKNKWWCNKYESLLTNTPTLLELPPNLKHFCTYEDLSDTFLEGRYYLSAREKDLFEHIQTMSLVNQELTKLKINYLNTVLLYGPSGTGKTTFGKYIAYKMGLPFLYINFSNLIDSLMGRTAQNLSLIFNFVQQNKCVFMIDEIDTISTRRAGSGSGADAEVARITVTLMQELDKLSNEHILLGATNREDMMDEALLRRFSKKHKVQVLSTDEKVCMVEQFLKDVGVTYSEDNVKNYCHINEDTAQSQIINEVIEAIVKTITDGTSFQLVV